MKQTLSQRISYTVLAILTVILFSCGDSGTTTISPLVEQVRISANLQNGTEGTPGTEYLFSAQHPTTTLPIEYRWRFDDFSAPRTLRGTADVKHTFGSEGWFTITVELVNYENNTVAGKASYVVNIRGAAPVIDMIGIPAGSFSMGSIYDNSEQPVHRVQISRNLFVAKYELLQLQWRAVMGTAPSWFQGDSLPVENVSWYQAIDFCNRLSVRQGLTPCYSIKGDTVQCFFSANGYRLPTEAEWEYIARAGETREFYGGTVEQLFANCTEADSLDSDLDTIAWYCMNANERTHPVGKKKPNAFGLYDVIGNVAEWCWDIHDTGYYTQSPLQDPIGASSGENRAVRGGSFYEGAFYARLSNRRLNAIPKQIRYTTGFRLVRSGAKP